MSGWIGVDLDGTLAEYHGWQGATHIGPPIPKMVERVKGWIAEGKDVRIFTARVSPRSIAAGTETLAEVVTPIYTWCDTYLGQRLEITHEKDLGMVELWDDRCVQVYTNTGTALDETIESLMVRVRALETHLREIADTDCQVDQSLLEGV